MFDQKNKDWSGNNSHFQTANIMFALSECELSSVHAGAHATLADDTSVWSGDNLHVEDVYYSKVRILRMRISKVGYFDELFQK